MSFPAPEPFPPPRPPDAPSREEVVAQAQEWAAQAAASRARRAPWRRPALEAGPALADIDAAVECSCGCHPQPPSFDIHEGGPECPCQLPPEQARARRDAALSALREALPTAVSSADSSERDELARRLGVELVSCGGMAPFVIEGVVDGRFFYLRERHDEYRVVMASDENPLVNVWKSYDSPGVLVARGVSDDFLVDGVFSEAEALRISVLAVRVALRRPGCSHAEASGAWFCSRCGDALPGAGFPPGA